MVFCNWEQLQKGVKYDKSHNPYFNRWFSAIAYVLVKNSGLLVTILILIDGFLQCEFSTFEGQLEDVTILILIDGFLQLRC